MAWTAVAKPTRGATVDGAFVDGTTDGAYTPIRGDGILASDGTWTPTLEEYVAWSTLGKPTPTGIFLADGSHLADGSISSSESGWVTISVS
jgi:hypothetical protein